MSHDRGDGAMGLGDTYHLKSDNQTTTTCILNFFGRKFTGGQEKHFH
jgi:hypothetical protein